MCLKFFFYFHTFFKHICFVCAGANPASRLIDPLRLCVLYFSNSHSLRYGSHSNSRGTVDRQEYRQTSPSVAKMRMNAPRTGSEAAESHRKVQAVSASRRRACWSLRQQSKMFQHICSDIIKVLKLFMCFLLTEEFQCV